MSRARPACPRLGQRASKPIRVYRRPDGGNVGRDEKLDFRTTTWVLTSEISRILEGHRDGEVVHVDDSDIRNYLAETRPDLDVDEVLAGSGSDSALEGRNE